MHKIQQALYKEAFNMVPQLYKEWIVLSIR